MYSFVTQRNTWILCFGSILLGSLISVTQNNVFGVTLAKGVGMFYLRLSLFYSRLVFVAYGELAWSFLLTVEIRFGLF